MAQDKEEVLKRFEPRSMDGEQLKDVADVREAFKGVASTVLSLVPAGREQAIVLTHLEAASFMAVAGIARVNG